MKFKCILCGFQNYSFFLTKGEDFEYGVKGKFNLIKCGRCGLVSLSPTPPIKELLTFYPSSYHSYNIPVSNLTKFLTYLNLEKEAKKFKELIGRNGKILDVGCADGRHFDILKRFGKWQFVGIDFNDEIVCKGQKAGREIYSTTLEKFNYPEQSFDLIIMDHLLEHVVNPVETLHCACRLLKKDGYILGAIPNINSLDRIFFGRYWGGYHFPRHLWHFTPETLSVVLLKTGFKLKKINYELHTGHWALSIQNFLQSKKITKSKIKQGRTFYFPIFLFFLIPLNFMQKLFHYTGIISFVARKNKREIY